MSKNDWILPFLHNFAFSNKFFIWRRSTTTWRVLLSQGLQTSLTDCRDFLRYSAICRVILRITSWKSNYFRKTGGCPTLKVPWYSAANKGRSMVNYCQSLAFDHPYLSFNDHCDWWLFQEIFFFEYYFYFLEILWAILILFFWNLFIFYSLFHNHFVYLYSPPFHTFPLHVNTGWICSMFYFSLLFCNHSM